MAGLLMCYTAGLPFLSNTVVGDLFFSSALFGVYHWAMYQAKFQPRTIE
jgi:formate-dependent nitrite reductase membrane component NrfD